MLELSIKKPEDLQKVSRALSSKIRLEIINLLNTRNANVHQLADSLQIPVSTAASHVKVLEEAGLILTELRPASRGAMKVCTRNFDDIRIQLNDPKDHKSNYKSFEMEIPIGHYVDFSVVPTCGMANHEKILVPEDQPVHFFSPHRTNAQIIWTRKGYFEYKFPLVIPEESKVDSVQISMELCSEAPSYDHNWPSDITVWFNDVEIGTWRSPGDFGDRPGMLNPEYWKKTNRTQYGTLKTWKVTNDSSMIDDFHLSNVTVDNLNLSKHDFLSFRIGIKDDAIHKGGINLFGREFGNYPQDIKLKVNFS
ncbi:ArsR/SmtB family transcription factor [Gracilibacillus xinjiangensis]|uniref:ArsR/SmtB family transcription factor n=1 Tax=Gracilibacillus xinjiangensis TaxID=1193282 RepID=A0ABV8WQ89_9BACI